MVGSSVDFSMLLTTGFGWVYSVETGSDDIVKERIGDRERSITDTTERRSERVGSSLIFVPAS